jgi:hypothetical protein
LSISQSAIRLNAIAAVRAQTIAATTPAATRHVGHPPAATHIAPKANGSAKIVWENRMNRRKSASAFMR